MLRLVLQVLEAGRGAFEVLDLIEHPRLLELASEASQLVRLEVGRELRQEVVVVGKDGALARLVGDDRHLADLGRDEEVPVGAVGVAPTESAGGFAVRAVRDPEVVGRHGLARGGRVVEVAPVLTLRLVDQLVGHVPVALHPELVADAEEGEGGVVAVGAADPLDLAADVLGDALVEAEELRLQADLAGPVVDPEGRLRLEVEPELVRRLERGLGGTPGVEAYVVEAVLADRAEDLEPLGGGHRRVAGARVDAAVEGPAQEDASVVVVEVPLLTAQLAKAEGAAQLVDRSARGEGGDERVGLRVELVPAADLRFDRQGLHEGARSRLEPERVLHRGELLSSVEERESQLRVGRRREPVLDDELDADRTAVGGGETLEVTEADGRGGGELDASDHPVPPRLRLGAVRVADDADRVDEAVVDADGESMFTGLQRPEVVAVLGDQAVEVADRALVDPDV